MLISRNCSRRGIISSARPWRSATVAMEQLTCRVRNGWCSGAMIRMASAPAARAALKSPSSARLRARWLIQKTAGAATLPYAVEIPPPAEMVADPVGLAQRKERVTEGQEQVDPLFLDRAIFRQRAQRLERAVVAGHRLSMGSVGQRPVPGLPEERDGPFPRFTRQVVAAD